MKKNKIYYLLPVLFFLCVAGCNSSDSPSDTPTTGEIKISVDETFKPVIDAEIYTFESIYTYADVEPIYKPESEAVNDLMSDSVRLIIVPRTLNAEELKEFERWEIVPKITKIAYDAVALICHKEMSDSTINLKELASLLSGTNVTSFKNVKVVFDNNSSSTLNYLMDKTQVKKLSQNCFALNSNEAVLEYVAKEKNTIGVIGVNWISDKDDTTKTDFLNTVKVMEVSESESTESYKPYQAYIAQKVYPLWREIYVLSREAYTGLGTGFNAFIASERGQRIILKQGLIPATMPVRIVEFKETEDL